MAMCTYHRITENSERSKLPVNSGDLGRHITVHEHFSPRWHPGNAQYNEERFILQRRTQFNGIHPET